MGVQITSRTGAGVQTAGTRRRRRHRAAATSAEQFTTTVTAGRKQPVRLGQQPIDTGYILRNTHPPKLAAAIHPRYGHTRKNPELPGCRKVEQLNAT